MTPDREVREWAFEALYTVHYREIAGYVLRRVPAHAADDVIAQVFVVAWRRFDHVPPPADQLWLLRVARNSVADQRLARQAEERMARGFPLEWMDTLAASTSPPGRTATWQVSDGTVGYVEKTGSGADNVTAAFRSWCGGRRGRLRPGFDSAEGFTGHSR